MKFEPVIALPTAWTSVCGQFVLHLFEGRLSLADMQHMQDLAARWLTKHPERRVELVVVLPSSANMTMEERQRMARLIKQGEPQRAASGTVILAQGLTGSFQRSVLTGLMLLVPPPHPAKVFAGVQDAVRWLHPHARALMPKLELEQLVAAVDAHVATFRARTRDDAASVSP
jgi:hypothetical protein